MLVAVKWQGRVCERMSRTKFAELIPGKKALQECIIPVHEIFYYKKQSMNQGPYL